MKSANIIRFVFSQIDDENEQIFSFEKTYETAQEVNSKNLTANMLTLLHAAVKLARLTNTNKPKLSKHIQVEIGINRRTEKLAIKFSLSENRIETLAGRLPEIFYFTAVTSGKWLQGAGLKIVSANMVFAAPKKMKELGAAQEAAAA